EQREVLVAVAVEVALVEVDVVARREIARMNGLAFAVTGGLQHLAREVAVADLEAGAEHVADVQVLGEWIDLIPRRRGDDGDRVALLQVRLNQRTRLRIDVGGEAIAEDALADGGELRFGCAAQRRGGAGDERRKTDLAELELSDRHRRLEHAARTHPSGDDTVADELDHREAGEQRA